MWDELRRRHPGLWIDNCASGGRRIDLETLTRSLPLWPSDFHDTIGLATGLGSARGRSVHQCRAGAVGAPVRRRGLELHPLQHPQRDHRWLSPLASTSTTNTSITDDHPFVSQRLEVMAKGKTLLDDDFPLADCDRGHCRMAQHPALFPGDFHHLLPLTICLPRLVRVAVAQGRFGGRHRGVPAPPS